MIYFMDRFVIVYTFLRLPEIVMDQGDGGDGVEFVLFRKCGILLLLIVQQYPSFLFIGFR